MVSQPICCTNFDIACQHYYIVSDVIVLPTFDWLRCYNVKGLIKYIACSLNQFTYEDYHKRISPFVF